MLAASKEHKNFLMRILNQNKELRGTKLLFKGSKDGFTANSFHTKCD